MKKIQTVWKDGGLLVLFMLGCFLFISLNFTYWFHFMEQYMLFWDTKAYWSERIVEIGGLNEYLSEFLTQGFSYAGGPAWIVALLSGGISFLFYGYMRACGARPSMLVAILPMFLPWLFPIENITPLLAVLWAFAGIHVYRCVRLPYLRYGAGVVIVALLYWWAAPAHLLVAMLMAVYELCISAAGNQRRNSWVASLLFLAWAVLLPFVGMRLFWVVPVREAFLSRYLYHPEYPLPSSFWLLWFSFPVLAVLAYRSRKVVWPGKASVRFVLAYGLLVLGIAWGIFMRKNPMEQAYCYDYYARQGAWDRIVEHARQKGVADQDALVYLNLALSYTGQLDKSVFDFPQIGEAGFIPHEPRTRLGLIEASEVCWRIGQVNAAQRFAFVGVLSSQRRVQPRLMQRLVDTYLVNGEYRAAEKYIKLLEASPRYRSWAEGRRALLDPRVCGATDWVAEKRRLLSVTDNPIDPTQVFPSALAFLLDDHPENRPAFDYGMAYLLVHKQLPPFMHYMELELKRGGSFPDLYQEAICLYYATVEQNPEAFRRYAVRPEISRRFSQFVQALSKGTPASLLEKTYGDTYYFYYYAKGKR